MKSRSFRPGPRSIATAALLVAGLLFVLTREETPETSPLDRGDRPSTTASEREESAVESASPGSPGQFEIAEDLREFSSNLPLVLVDTSGQRPDRYRDWIDSTLTIFAPDESGRTRLGGEVDFHGTAGFRYRGRSSTSLWPKKQFSIEIRDELGVDRYVSILGMPAESDWILLGPYSDKSLIRNVLAYRWSNAIGRYASRTRLVELFLNFDDAPVRFDDYHGVYVALEKPKLGPERVALAPLEPAMTSEPEITGGYLLRKDWGESALFVTKHGMELEYREPKFREINTEQASWIERYIDQFESALYGGEFADKLSGYEKYIDVDSFVDHFLLVELTKNGDAYYHSTYVHKDRGRKLGMGPIWDYNLSMGNFGHGELSSPRGWYWPYRSEPGTHEWYARLLEDPRFSQRVIDRWTSLRSDRFSEKRLLQDIDELAARLDEAQRRNFERWPVLGAYVRYNARGWDERDSYAAEIEFLRAWVRERLAWLDVAVPRLESS